MDFSSRPISRAVAKTSMPAASMLGGQGPCAGIFSGNFRQRPRQPLRQRSAGARTRCRDNPRTRTPCKTRRRMQSSQARVPSRSPTVSGLRTTGGNHPGYHRDKNSPRPGTPSNQRRSPDEYSSTMRRVSSGDGARGRTAKVLSVSLAAVPAFEPDPLRDNDILR